MCISHSNPSSPFIPPSCSQLHWLSDLFSYKPYQIVPPSPSGPSPTHHTEPIICKQSPLSHIVKKFHFPPSTASSNLHSLTFLSTPAWSTVSFLSCMHQSGFLHHTQVFFTILSPSHTYFTVTCSSVKMGRLWFVTNISWLGEYLLFIPKLIFFLIV